MKVKSYSHFRDSQELVRKPFLMGVLKRVGWPSSQSCFNLLYIYFEWNLLLKRASYPPSCQDTPHDDKGPTSPELPPSDPELCPVMGCVPQDATHEGRHFLQRRKPNQVQWLEWFWRHVQTGRPWWTGCIPVLCSLHISCNHTVGICWRIGYLLSQQVIS